jgi:pre-rRNA-processing protein TSR4
MAPSDEFSDSDDEGPTEIQTSVLLGLPDGAITNPLDLADPAVSRMGGLPVHIVSC